MSRNRSLVPLLIMVVGGVLILGAGIWLFFNLNPQASTQSTEVIAGDQYPDIVRVSVADAKAAYDSGSAVFVDVRDVESFDAQHITGALSIPLADIQARMGELDPNAWIITYCT